MASDNVDLIRSLYGFNWVAVEERANGLTASAEVLAPDVAARMSPQVSDRTLRGLQDFVVFVEGVEEDFSEFRYDAHEFEVPAPDQVVVRGTVRVRGRRSNVPLSAPFGHVWTLRDGKAVSVEAQLLLDGAEAAG